MNRPAFDTHQAVTTLAEAKPGLPLAEAIVDTIGVAMENVATKDDIKQINNRLDNIDGRFDNLAKSNANMSDRIDLLGESMDAKLSANINQMIRWMVGSVLTAGAVITMVGSAMITISKFL